jgi:hypothetical protein
VVLGDTSAQTTAAKWATSRAFEFEAPLTETPLICRKIGETDGQQAQVVLLP